jgi:hypothetical protein
MLSGKQQELLACFRALELESADGAPPRARVAELLEALWLHVRMVERHVYPLVLRLEGPERASQESELLLTLRELMWELECLPRGSVEWLARLVALDDVVVAHIRSLEMQLFPRLAEALAEDEELDLIRGLAATRELLQLEIRRGLPPETGWNPLDSRPADG